MTTDVKCKEIVFIEKFPKPIHGWFFYGRMLGIFGKKAIRSSGIFIFFENIVKDDVIKRLGLYVENDQVYYKPYARFHLSDGSRLDKTFNTISEMDHFVSEAKSSNTIWIKI